MISRLLFVITFVNLFKIVKYEKFDNKLTFLPVLYNKKQPVPNVHFA